MKPLILVLPILVTCGCGARATAPDTDAQADGADRKESWFCQVGTTDDEWDCVKGWTAANRKPTRLPASRAPTRNPRDAPASPTTRQAPNMPAANTPSVVDPPTVPNPQQQPAPVPPPERNPAAGGGLDQQSTRTPEVPVHVQLSYRPAQPVAILDLPEEFWAVQLVALSSKAALESYAETNNIKGMSAARVWNGEKMFYVLLLGVYETRGAAQQAIASLSAPFELNNAWIRSLASLQAAMLAADREAGSAEI